MRELDYFSFGLVVVNFIFALIFKDWGEACAWFFGGLTLLRVIK